MIPDNRQLEKIAASLPPALISRFLERRGFRCHGERSGVLKVYVNESGDLLPVPSDQGSLNYGRRVLDVVENLTDTDANLDDVLGLISRPDSDIIRYRIGGPEADTGQLRLAYAHKAMLALYDMLKFAAAGVY